MCAYHIQKRREECRLYYKRHKAEIIARMKKNRKKYKEDGRCPTCGGPSDAGYTKCARCIGWRTELLPKGAYKYGTYPESCPG